MVLLNLESNERTVPEFIILVGIPGVGKSYFAKEYLRNLENQIIIERDKIRVDLIWQARKEGKTTEKMNQKVDLAELELVKQEIKQNKHKYVILDGCHTHYCCLEGLISTISLESPASEILLMFIGNENSVCLHKISDEAEGIYSDYKEDGSHDSIPKIVIDKKREQLGFILTNMLNSLRRYCDSVMLLRQPREPYEQARGYRI